MGPGVQGAQALRVHWNSIWRAVRSASASSREAGHQVQAHVDAGADAARGDDAPLIDPAHAAAHIQRRELPGEIVEVFPVGGDRAAVQHAAGRQQKGAGAHRGGELRGRGAPWRSRPGSRGTAWPGPPRRRARSTRPRAAHRQSCGGHDRHAGPGAHGLAGARHAAAPRRRAALRAGRERCCMRLAVVNTSKGPARSSASTSSKARIATCSAGCGSLLMRCASKAWATLQMRAKRSCSTVAVRSLMCLRAQRVGHRAAACRR